MQKSLRRILALIGAAALLFLYILTLIFALRHDPAAGRLFFTSLAMTVLIPVLIYAMQLAANVLRPRKSPVIDAVVFDMGSVLIRFPFREELENMGFSPEGLSFIREVIVPGTFFADMDLDLKSRSEIEDEYASIRPELREDIHKFVYHVYDCLTPMPFADEWVDGLRRAGLKLYILSNWPRHTYEYCRENGVLAIEDKFDGAVWSYPLHMIKPDPAIYQHLIEKYSLDPSRTVFIDDREDNVEAAKKCGFAAFRFTDYPTALKKLASLGVHIR